ncbi:response regulator [Aggregicoccus sp. 17bor-14]|uniref:response regulator n=1 Tax=Myxococcaceae TaxID=31 RepID=UPI00129C1E69|nr:MULTISPECIES: response regulator [Myxococcaceae]MBF5042456.1 response regulator [Simulacricoccus sp. 17bor-14]MRI88227.1 response regulator [Aggregicoccus sp. 17bor-14]
MLESEHERVVRLWSKRLRAETYEVDLPGRDLRAPLARLIDELVRLLRDRGDDALRLWPEVVRNHGARRYDQRFEAEDLAREFKALQEVLLRVYARYSGGLEPEVAELIANLVGEAHASAQASFSRVLRTEEVRFREAAVMESVLNHVEVGILLAETDGTVSFVTPPVSRLLGVPLRMVVGSRDSGLLGALLTQLQAKHYPGNEPFKVQDLPYQRALKERRPVRTVKMRVQRPGAGEAILELSATPLWEEGGSGELVGAIQTVSDRTEAAAKTAALVTAHDELRRLQGRLLQRTRTQALGQLAGGAAHALNNFLNVLRLRITLLRREFKPEHLDALDRTVGNIGDLISRLQEFSVQRTEESLTDAELDGVVREALELARSELENREHPVELDVRLSAHSAKVHVDAGFLRELVVNLLFAARDRMPQGGRLMLSSRTEENSWLTLRIQDMGPPYSVDALAQLFDPLNRASSTPHVSLLLAVARHQVQRWGGELTVENVKPEEGVKDAKGAAFVVRLPRALEVGREQQPAAARTPVPRRFQLTRKVLVVDDDADNARMMAEVLGEEGYNVHVAPSGDVALKMWEMQRYDAALLDALMPDMSGWEVARELRKRSPQVLLAIVTGMDVRGQNRANLALVDAVFRKPIDVGALDEFLGQSGAHALADPGGAGDTPPPPTHAS